MEKRRIKVKFIDFWDGFDAPASLLYKQLEKKYDVELSDEPEYLFFSVFGNGHLRYNSCVKIFYTGENQCPDFNLCDYAIGFEHLDLNDRYLRFPFFYNYETDYALMESKHNFTVEDLEKKSGFCSFVYSNNNASPERDRFFDLLSQYKTVSSGGRHRNNVGGAVDDKMEFQSRHKFAIAFENTSHPGYATEKIVQAFAARTVPVYWGDPRIGELFNDAAFVNCHNYPTLEEAAKAVVAIDQDDRRYLAMMRVPALLEDTPTKQSQIDDLRDFLFHIIDQPYGEAFRFSREYWGARYCDLAVKREKAYNNSLRGIAERFYKKTLWKWRRKSRLMWKIDRLFKKR